MSSLVPDTGPPLDGSKYRLVTLLARGGMGEVWLAEHVALRAEVVVKLLEPSVPNQEDLGDRMRLEGQALAQLRHPNIVSVIDAGRTASGRPFLVMERLRGTTLAHVLDARPTLPPIEASALVRQILAGLSAAHAVGIVHRDVKASNLFLCDGAAPDPTVSSPQVLKLIDFGIAKVVREPEDSGKLLPLAFPTVEGTVLGTPAALSPEQAQGRAVDHRSDIYAVGLLLYRMLKGERAFASLHGPALIFAHSSRVPDPPSRGGAQWIPEELEEAVLKALSLGPKDRFQSASEFAKELLRIEDVIRAEQARRSAALRRGDDLGATPSSSGAATRPTVAIDSATVPRVVEEIASSRPGVPHPGPWNPLDVSVPQSGSTERLSTGELAALGAASRRGPHGGDAAQWTDEAAPTRTAEPSIAGLSRSPWLTARFLAVAAVTALVVVLLLTLTLLR